MDIRSLIFYGHAPKVELIRNMIQIDSMGLRKINYISIQNKMKIYPLIIKDIL
jgi:hypothetical protein